MTNALVALGESPDDAFQALAKAADYSNRSHHGRPELGRQAKTKIEMDRNAAAVEAGYHTALTKLLRDEQLAEAKSDVLIGMPLRSRPEFHWVWQKDRQCHPSAAEPAAR